jgi:hypothetical protein
MGTAPSTARKTVRPGIRNVEWGHNGGQRGDAGLRVHYCISATTPQSTVVFARSLAN